MILTILAEHQQPSSFLRSFSAKLGFRGGGSGGNAATCKGVSVVADRGAVEK